MNTWPPLLREVGQRRAGQAEDGGEVRGEDAVPELVARLRDRRVRAHARVVDQDLQAAAGLHGRPRRPRAGVRAPAGRPGRRWRGRPPARSRRASDVELGGRARHAVTDAPRPAPAPARPRGRCRARRPSPAPTPLGSPWFEYSCLGAGARHMAGRRVQGLLQDPRGAEGPPRAKEIKAAYRKLARKYHPDFNKGDAKAEARFKEVNEAQRGALRPREAPAVRHARARLGEHAPAGRRTGPGRAGGTSTSTPRTSAASPTSSAPSSAAAAGSARAPAARAVGDSRTCSAAACPTQPGHDLETHDRAHARRGGARHHAHASRSATTATPRTVEVRIPPGVRESSRVRAAGEGAPGARGRRGDLYMKVHVLPHPLFERKGDDLQAAVHGAPHHRGAGRRGGGPDGRRADRHQDPARARGAGRTFRLRGHGLPKLESPAREGRPAGGARRRPCRRSCPRASGSCSRS